MYDLPVLYFPQIEMTPTWVLIEVRNSIASGSTEKPDSLENFMNGTATHSFELSSTI